MEKSAELTQLNLEKVQKIKIFQIKTSEELENICMVGESEKVEMGEYLLLEKNENITAYSYGAGPCISGIIQTDNNKLYMFHSLSYETTLEQKEIIKNASNLIVGSGEKESLDIFKSEFKYKNIKILSPPKDNYFFNIVFVKDKNKFKVLPGLYFSFEAVSDLI
jgi:hypothetical protein